MRALKKEKEELQVEIRRKMRLAEGVEEVKENAPNPAPREYDPDYVRVRAPH